MKEYYPMTIAGLERRLPLCPISDELKIGAFVIFGDPELTTACARELLKRCPEHDVLITAESKGIPLICEMARLLGNERYILARKGAKLYMRDVFAAEVHSITTDHQQTLYLDGADAGKSWTLWKNAMKLASNVVVVVVNYVLSKRVIFKQK